ncbi:hypothetical protein OHD50_26575 [Escherichia coli]|nr:hypothetical protein [Escherichia coli]
MKNGFLLVFYRGYEGTKGKTNWYVVIPEEQITKNEKEDALTRKLIIQEYIEWTFDSAKGTGLLKQRAAMEYAWYLGKRF